MVPSGSHGHIDREIPPMNAVAVEFGIRHILDEDRLPHGPPSPGHGVRRRVVAGLHRLGSNNEFGSRSPSLSLGVNIILARDIAEYESLCFSWSSTLAPTALACGLGVLQAVHVYFFTVRYRIGLPSRDDLERMEIVREAVFVIKDLPMKRDGTEVVDPDQLFDPIQIGVRQTSALPNITDQANLIPLEAIACTGSRLGRHVQRTLIILLVRNLVPISREPHFRIVDHHL